MHPLVNRAVFLMIGFLLGTGGMWLALRSKKPAAVVVQSVPPVASERRPAFNYPFLSRETWTNAGLVTPFAAVQTFLWAYTTQNESTLIEASEVDANGEPIRLTGMALDFHDRLLGVQVLSIGLADRKNTNRALATLVFENYARMDGSADRSHGTLSFWLEKGDGVWRFAGRNR